MACFGGLQFAHTDPFFPAYILDNVVYRERKGVQGIEIPLSLQTVDGFPSILPRECKHRCRITEKYLSLPSSKSSLPSVLPTKRCENLGFDIFTLHWPLHTRK